MNANKSNVIPSDRPQSFRYSFLRPLGRNNDGLCSSELCPFAPFSTRPRFSSMNFSSSCSAEWANVTVGYDVSITIAGNFMLPTSSLTRSLKIVECLGASREEASTVTLDHFGFLSFALSFPRFSWGRRTILSGSSSVKGTQWSDVPGAGSTAVVWGVSWRKTKGERIMRSRLPKEVVISRSSSWPMERYAFSARSKPISSHVCRIARHGISHGGL